MKKTLYLFLILASNIASGSEVRKTVFEAMLSNEHHLEQENGNPNRFPAQWEGSNSPSAGFIFNETGINNVVKSLTLHLDAVPFPSNPGGAVDVCLYVSPQGAGVNNIDIKLTVTQNEIVCFNQNIGQNIQWPQSTLKIEFPGQGILVPPGAGVACDSQFALPEGISVPRGQLKEVSKFACEVAIADYEPSSTAGPAYASVRAPYFDESFIDTAHSRVALHTNLTNRALEIDGVWVYNGTSGYASKVCFYKPNIRISEHETVSKICKDFPSTLGGGAYTTQPYFQPFKEVWLPGETLTATCSALETSNASLEKRKYCSFYFMVEIDDSAGLHRSDTISTNGDHVSDYCHRISGDDDFTPYYTFTGFEDGSFCETVLNN